MALFEVKDLSVRFNTFQGEVRAVDGVSFALEEGETLGLVGESGSGKSVTSLAILGLVPSPPGEVVSGSVFFEGRDLLRLSPRELRRVRGRRVAMIFQDPMTSLNPFLTIGRQLGEVLEVHEGLSRREARSRSKRALDEVGLAQPERTLDRHPHQLSGGMRQRVMIAMALSTNPRVLLADEPTTALDVTTQAQILELLAELQRRHGTAIVLVTHDLGVVAGRSDRVSVMYAGRIVEAAGTDELFARPAHPYTAGLLASVPRLTGEVSGKLSSIPGQPPDPARLPAGCAFAARCPRAREECEARAPELASLPVESERRAACFYPEQLLEEAGGAR